MGIRRKTGVNLFHPLMQQGMFADVFAKFFELIRSGQFAVDEKVGSFGKIASFSDHFDGIPPISEDSILTIEEGYRAPRGSGIGIAFVERDAAGRSLQFADIDGPSSFGSRQNGEFVGLIVDREFGGLIHAKIPL
jgi:hypothetical protein